MTDEFEGVVWRNAGMSDDEAGVEAARFLRWHLQKGGKWAPNFAEWVRARALGNKAARDVAYVVMGALLKGYESPETRQHTLNWISSTIPNEDDILADFNTPPDTEPPF